MKTIILIRHSEPIKDRTMPTMLLPLSQNGHIKVREMFLLDIFRSIDAVYTSPYQRAYSTAEKLCGHLIIDNRLREREIGNIQTLNDDFWRRQYDDHDYKNTGGESLNDVNKRMTSVIGEIVSIMQEENTVAVVSHAAAICAFLLNWCSVEVTNEQKKERKIKYNGTVVLDGKIEMPSAFILGFENDRLCKINYIYK